jgi:hypothetical protein
MLFHAVFLYFHSKGPRMNISGKSQEKLHL